MSRFGQWFARTSVKALRKCVAAAEAEGNKEVAAMCFFCAAFITVAASPAIPDDPSDRAAAARALREAVG